MHQYKQTIKTFIRLFKIKLCSCEFQVFYSNTKMLGAADELLYSNICAGFLRVNTLKGTKLVFLLTVLYVSQSLVNRRGDGWSC